MIPAERLDQIAEVVRRAGLNTETIAALREAFGNIHFTHCSDDDIGLGQPVRTADGFNLDPVDGRERCLA